MVGFNCTFILFLIKCFNNQVQLLMFVFFGHCGEIFRTDAFYYNVIWEGSSCASVVQGWLCSLKIKKDRSRT